MNNNRILCVFVKPDDKMQTIEFISKAYDIPNRKIIVLESQSTNDLLFLMEIKDSKSPIIPKNSIYVYRNRKHNVIYTIDAVNAMNMMENGFIKPEYKVNWHRFQNCFLKSNNGELQHYETKLNEIIKL